VKGTLLSHETAASRRQQGEDWHPSWAENTFCCWLKCDGDCHEDVAVIGSSTLEEDSDQDEDGTWRQVWNEVYRPLACIPALDVFPIPRKTPPDVRKELKAAFRLVWRDRGSAASRLRVSLERLLDSLGVQKKRRTSSGKYETLTLHHRIEQFGKKKPRLAEQLMAIKWFGNTASHTGDVERDELLTAFEILEHTLNEVFAPPSVNIARLVQTLTRRHKKR
jgi:hypothetical protein